jgi:hypothetical protein
MIRNGGTSPVPTMDTVLLARNRRVVRGSRGSRVTWLTGSDPGAIGSRSQEPIDVHWLVLSLDATKIATLLG